MLRTVNCEETHHIDLIPSVVRCNKHSVFIVLNHLLRRAREKMVDRLGKSNTSDREKQHQWTKSKVYQRNIFIQRMIK